VIGTGSEWVVATSNRGKLRELRALLANMGVALRAQDELGIAPPREPASSFVENALLKARHASRIARMPALADDSGLVVAALGGAPGVRSARFAGDGRSDAANVRRLLELLADVPAPRTASFHCVAVLMRHAEDPVPLIASGEWAGSICCEPAGMGGFGYDPVFFDPALGMTAAELPADLKNQVSHRAAALRTLRALLAPPA